jgi:hypothetical protein
MKGVHERLLRLEALSQRPAPHGTPAERAAVAADVAQVLSLSPPGVDRGPHLRALLERLDRGEATGEDLARAGAVNLSVLRLVSRLEASC